LPTQVVTDSLHSNRRWQWTIRGMLVLTTLVAVPLALYVNHDRRPSARTVAMLRKLGCHVLYDYQQQGESGYGKLAKWFGEDYFGSVKSVRMDGGQISQEQLEMLLNLPQLEWLLFSHVNYTGADWKALGQLHELKNLDLWACSFDDEDIDALRPLANLQQLNLNQSMITDQGLVTLADFQQLKSLELFQTMISPKGLAGIRAALPNCHIQDVGTPAVLAVILKMPDGRRTNQYEGGFTVKLSSNARSSQISSSRLRPGNLWFDGLPENDGTVAVTVTLDNRYSGSVSVTVANGVATPKYVEVPMQDLRAKAK
jgi:hypothetical protein